VAKTFNKNLHSISLLRGLIGDPGTPLAPASQEEEEGGLRPPLHIPRPDGRSTFPGAGREDYSVGPSVPSAIPLEALSSENGSL